MNIKDPCHSRFAADVRDIMITGLSNSIDFALHIGGAAVLHETYNYDADGAVAIRGLSDVVSKALYGDLITGHQEHARNSVGFYIGGVQIFAHTLYASRMRNPKDPDGAKNVLIMADKTVCHPGRPFYVTTIGSVPLKVYNDKGQEAFSTTVGSADGSGDMVVTTDCDPLNYFRAPYSGGGYMDVGGEVRADILPAAPDEAVSVRFLNRYDVMESLTAAYMSEKPSASDSVSLMYGQKTRFTTESSTEYTLYSGQLRHKEQFDTWQDLLTSRKAQVYVHGQWHDIIVTKGNYTRHRRTFYGSQAEISFKTADPTLIL